MRKFKISILLSFLYFYGFLSIVEAQVFELRPIEVQGGYLSLIEEEPSSCSIIFPSEYEGELKDLGELLSKVPGVHVTRLGGRGAYTVVSIRGSTSAQVAVYLNGILMNTGGEGAVDLSTIPLNAVERIEVYRGSVPARFGISGIGGVINIITSSEAQFKTFKASLGSFRSYALENVANLKDWLFSISFEGNRGDYPYHNDNGTPYNLTDDYDTRRQNNAYRTSDIKISKKLGKRGNLFLNYFSKFRELPKPAPGSDRDGNTSHSNLSSERLIAEVSNEIFFSEKLKGNLYIYGMYMEQEFLNPFEDIGWTGQKHNWYTSHKVGAGLSINYLIDENNLFETYLDVFREGLNLGGDLVNQGELSPLRGIKDYTRDSISVSFDYIISKGKFSLIPWFRFLSVSDESKKLNSEKTSSRLEHLSYGFRLKYKLSETWSIKTNWGSFARVPTFYEKFGDGAFIVPNPNLEVEEGENFDFGLNFSSERVSGYITYFRSNMDNLIEFTLLNPRFGRYINIKGAKVNGIETGISCYSKDGWSLSISYTYMKAESEVPGYREGKPLPNRPEHNLNLRVGRAKGEWEAFIEGEFIGENYFDTGGLVKFSDWWVLNVGFSYRPSDKEKVTLIINNLTDNRNFKTKPAIGFGPEKMADYPPPGRSFYLTYIKNF